MLSDGRATRRMADWMGIFVVCCVNKLRSFAAADFAEMLIHRCGVVERAIACISQSIKKKSRKYRITIHAMGIPKSHSLLICFGSIRNYEAIEKLCKPRLSDLSVRISRVTIRAEDELRKQQPKGAA